MNKIQNLVILVMITATTATISAQNFERTLKEEVYINSDANQIELNFAKKGKYTVYQGTSPATINWKAPIKVKNKKLILPRNSPRPFYGVITPNKDTLILAERKLVIADLDNFRDLGGLKTRDGRFVSWGRFYRSDALNDLLTSEFPYIEYLKINKVFDLRSDLEIAVAKDNLPTNVIYEHFPIFDDKNSGMLQGVQEKISDGLLTKSDAEELLMQANETFASHDAKKFNTLLHQIMVLDNAPNIFHCTAGKDRTGYTAAIILAILKVDKQTILDEYEMTNFYTEAQIKKAMTGTLKQKGLDGSITPEAIEVLLSVNKKYLEAAFDIIDKKYGGIDAYIKNQLGFSDAQRQEMIQKYTYKI